ncbi:MAG: STAS domain-containing protein [Phycisphaerales bacterium]
MNDSESGALTVSMRAVAEGVLMVVATGDIDLSGSPALRTQLKKAQETRPKRIIVDLSGVPYMDSSGLATLVEAMKSARTTQTKLVLFGLSDRVRSIFEIAKLESVFTIVADQSAAMLA